MVRLAYSDLLGVRFLRVYGCLVCFRPISVRFHTVVGFVMCFGLGCWDSCFCCGLGFLNMYFFASVACCAMCSGFCRFLWCEIHPPVLVCAGLMVLSFVHIRPPILRM